MKPIEVFLTDSKHYISQSSETRLHIRYYILNVIVLKKLVAVGPEADTIEHIT